MTENKGEQMEITGNIKELLDGEIRERIDFNLINCIKPLRATISLDPVDPKLIKSGDKVLVLKTVPSPSSYEPESFLKNNKIYTHFPTPEPPQERTSMHPLTELLKTILLDHSDRIWDDTNTLIRQYLQERANVLKYMFVENRIDSNIDQAFELSPSEPKCKTCGQEWTNHEPSACLGENPSQPKSELINKFTEKEIRILFSSPLAKAFEKINQLISCVSHLEKEVEGLREDK
jgi:hypothetical protein